MIAVCRVAAAHAIPDQDEDGKSGAGDKNWPCPTRKTTHLCADIPRVQAAPRSNGEGLEGPGIASVVTSKSLFLCASFADRI